MKKKSNTRVTSSLDETTNPSKVDGSIREDGDWKRARDCAQEGYKKKMDTSPEERLCHEHNLYQSFSEGYKIHTQLICL